MKRLFLIFLGLCFALSGCTPRQDVKDDTLHILATTYPIYLFTKTLTDGVDGVEVTQLIDETVSCLHDYTLTVPDMKAIEKADIIILNGAGLESFMDDALAQSKAHTIDCSHGIELIPATGHEHHHDEDDHHHGHYDPHYWLSDEAGLTMLLTILQGLSRLDAEHKDAYHENFSAAEKSLPVYQLDASALSCPYIITFHDGFQYLAQDIGATILKSIEEESGSEASAADIKEIIALIKEYDIPAIFVEKNGSDATALAIARETGVAVYQLDMIMNGTGEDITAYSNALNANYDAIREALS